MEQDLAFIRGLPKAELHLIESGHFALEDNAEAIGAHIGQFLSKEAR